MHRTNYMRTLVNFILFFIFMSSWVEAHGGHHSPHSDAHAKQGQWTKEKTEFAQVRVQVSGPGNIQNFALVSGKVLMHPDSLGYVVPKASGSVIEVHKNIGESVHSGEILALIESQEVASARARYFIAQKKNNHQHLVLNKALELQNIVSTQELLDAELAAVEAEMEFKLAIQSLYALGFTQDEIDSITYETPSNYSYYFLKAPLSGKIFERNLNVGEWVDFSKQAFIVGNTQKVWVEMYVSQTDTHYLKKDLPVEITSTHGNSAKVSIYQFHPIISEETRTSTAIALINNPEEEWKPGQFITAKIATDVTPVSVAVPLNAVQIIKGERCVFIENGQEFTPCVVKLGKMDRNNVEIVAGLVPGITYAAENTFCLKADYEKEAAEHHH